MRIAQICLVDPLYAGLPPSAVLTAIRQHFLFMSVYVVNGSTFSLQKEKSRKTGDERNSTKKITQEKGDELPLNTFNVVFSWGCMVEGVGRFLSKGLRVISCFSGKGIYRLKLQYTHKPPLLNMP